MFAYIKGKLAAVGENWVVVDTNGVGYRISTSGVTIRQLPHLDEEVKMFTYLYVREDLMEIYGFSDNEQLSTFQLLISVSGVGPKVALAMLSTLAPSEFALAIVNSDDKTISKAPGIGKKLAQRIILELKDKIKSDELVSTKGIDMTEIPSDNISEAVSALMVLGYSAPEATQAVKAVQTEGTNVEGVIKQALKKMVSKK